MTAKEINELNALMININAVKWSNQNLIDVYKNPHHHYYVIQEIWSRCNNICNQIDLSQVNPTFQTKDNPNDSIHRVLKDILGDLSNKKYEWLIPLYYDCERFFNLQTIEQNISKSKDLIKGSIFLSHSSKDKKIVSDFKYRILSLGLGLDDTKIFYTSSNGTDIKTGDNINREVIKGLQKSSVVILFISDNYSQSAVCLNEMGAAKVMEKKVIPFLLPGQKFTNLGLLSQKDIQLKIDKGADLLAFRENIKKFTNIKYFNASRFAELVDDFIITHKKTIKPKKS